MWQLAVDIPTSQPSDNTTAYLLFFGGIIATLGTIAVAWINSRKERTSSSPPATEDTALVGALRERVAVNESELRGLEQDHDELSEVVEIVDRRISKVEVQSERTDLRQEQILRYLDHNFPGWRG